MVKTRKVLLGLIIGTIASMATSIIALAGTWQSDTKGWWYQNDDGSYVANDWRWIDGNQDGIAECYYFDSAGWLLTSGITPDGYSVNENGAWVTGGKVEVKSVNTTAPTESIDSRTGTYHPVKHVYLDGTTYTTAKDLTDWGLVDIDIVEATEDAVVMAVTSGGEQKTYNYTRDGEIYRNDGEPGDGDWTAYMRFEADGTLVIFDDVYGNSYYRK